MNIEITTYNGVAIAELQSDAIEIHSLQDALDLLGNTYFQGADAVIVHQHQLIPEFFDLKTKIAGDILQKFATYGVRLAVVGNFEVIAEKNLKDFVFETNKSGKISFVDSSEKAHKILSKGK